MTRYLGLPLKCVCDELDRQGITYTVNHTGAPGREPAGNDWRVVRATRENTGDEVMLTVCAFQTEISE